MVPPYTLHGAHRETEFQVIVLCQKDSTSSQTNRKYFLCIDNRPLNNISDPDFFHLEEEEARIQENQKHYQQSLKDYIKEDSHCQDTFRLLSFSGKLSEALSSMNL